MSFDWKTAVRSIAPGVGALLGGPLAGAGVKILADALLGGGSGDQASDERALEKVMEGGLSPELKAKLIDADTTLKTEMIRAGIREKEIALAETQTFVQDTAHARQTHQSNVGVMRLGIAINLLSYALVAAVLWGCFELLTGTKIDTLDPTMAMSIGAIVGGAVQWIMQNAQQANGFFFGSSPGSRQMATDLSKAVGDAVQNAKKK